MGRDLPKAGRPDKDPRFTALIKNSLIVSPILVGVPFAGEGPNPLPMISQNLYDTKRRLASAGFPIPGALYYAFYNNTYHVPMDKGITVPAESLWWLAYPGDIVLLSDQITNHYTKISNIDRENERIYFVDPWPDDFFLLAGANRFSIKAGRHPSPNISASEFLHVVVGIITCDTTALIFHYLTHFPESAKNSEIIVQFGFTLLDTEANRFIADAARLFADAVALGPSPFFEIASTQVYLSTMCGLYFARSRNDKHEADELMIMMRKTIDSRNLFEIQAALTADDLLRLGHAAGIARDLGQAERYLTLSITKDPVSELAFFYRSIAALQSGNPLAAISDAEQALILNRRAIDSLEQKRAELAPYGRFQVDYHELHIRAAYARRTQQEQLLEQAKAI